ncbi:dynamin family protein [Cytobacillus purgationiresistens]|uniref:GTPase n=1 Tax=Cytobacillus purgationiresistens TaxID=863449 RepID=A0ABU0ALB4_9BACI|nr:dynamin family protein [Cytobacillus purgationiresistens]MDQ0272063.1 putative GTPase [Cytobacillus purgationiresistens]
MVQIVDQQLDRLGLLKRAAALYTFFRDNGDQQTAARAKDLVLKLRDSEFSIAFCGHFSAGKSSMINQMVGDDLLPSSPIPTSANLVRVKAGEDYAKVFFKEGPPKLYLAPYDYERIKRFSKDGDQIRTVEISHSDTTLPLNTVIMDTPGIDSTDDAHRIATESALHLADLVFYVMDYNHVQSELNFLFTKELTAAGKQVYLIINQIDKHREEELTFSQFTESVKDSFASWGVHPQRIFYTSLKKKDLAENEFPALQSFMQDMIANKEELLPQSVFHSLKKLSEEHLVYLEEKQGIELEGYESALADLPEDERPLVFEKVQSLQAQLANINKLLQSTEVQLNNDIDEILKNAYLMPFQTRELAEKYLESRQSDFKMGLFFAKQKTEQERQARLDRLFEDFIEKVQAQIVWHMKELFLKKFKEHDIHDDLLIAAAQNFQMTIDQEVLSSAVKGGARLSGDYVLQYTNDVAESVKKITKTALNGLKSGFVTSLQAKMKKEQTKIETELQSMQTFADALIGLNQLKENIARFKEELGKFLTGEYKYEKYEMASEQLLHEQEEEAEIVHPGEEEKVLEKEARNDATDEDEQFILNSEEDSAETTKHLVGKLKYTSEEIASVPGFKKISKELLQKAGRLENRQFTVALFGAFSAGKSSFANALIGEKLLPVSPNPTTAAINKIMPVNEENPHGTVLVRVKSQTVLFADINRSLQVFQREAKDFIDAIKKIKGILADQHDFDANEKTHFALLAAFSKGFDHFKDALGTIIQTDLVEFTDYVAKEEKSCFVEMIEVYYDCELTRKGISLVDTPGADSINARHTGVAFDYIKNSDAILFVTYYNHAFSKADREFLIQLGRVKDSFELDKMFFVVNAIDLANNESEKNDVLDYVSEQLIQYGIRKPHLYGLSSMHALQDKLSGTQGSSGIQAFEKNFYSFINNDLMKISVTSAESEWLRVLSQLQSFIQSSQDSKEAKDGKKRQLLREKDEINGILTSQDVSLLTQRLEQEADELVFYIKQRVFLRFGDFLKESFNPALLKDDGRDLKKALKVALNDFLQSFGFDFAQELRATTLRLEVYIGKQLQQSFDRLTKQAQEINQQLSFSRLEVEAMEGTDFETAFVELDLVQFKKAMSHFKNPKSFFEKNERKYLADELENALQVPADDYLQKSNQQLKDYYEGMLKQEDERLIASLSNQVEEYYEGMMAALTADFSVAQLIEIENRLKSYM